MSQSRLELVVLCGLQASGKSTFRRERLVDHVVVSKDLMRNNRRRELRQRELVREALDLGRSVVVDNTNPTTNDRLPLIRLGREAGARVVSYFIDSDFESCLERNNARPISERIPYVGLVDVSRRLRPPGPDEGFDERWVVTLAGRDDFNVAPAD